MTPLVIVRPEPGASATAEAARKLGLEPVVMPLFAIVPLEWNPPDPRDFDALLFTSANAIRHGGAGLSALRSLPAHCVGEATARVVREHGFQVASVGSGRVDGLLDSLPGTLRLLHLGGIHRHEPNTPRQAIHPIPVYRAEEIALPPAFEKLEDKVIAVHSPRAGTKIGELGLARDQTAIAAISREAAEAAGSGWAAVASAGEPSDTALLAIAAELCKNPARWSGRG
jgi:uroporphyrinogen-III synthase